MSKFPTEILAAVDPEGEDNLVIQSAAALAKSHKADLTVLTVIPNPLRLQHGLAVVEIEFKEDLTIAAESALERKCDEVGLAPKHAHIVRGRPQKEIAKFANSNDIDMICLGMHDRQGEEYFLGTTTVGVLRRANADIFCCRTELGENGFRDVVLAIEMDEHAAHTLHRAKQFLEPYEDAQIHVLNVVRPLDMGSGLIAESLWPTQPLRELTNRRMEATREYLPEFLEEHSLDAASIEVIEGVPSKVIKARVEALETDLLVMSTGTHMGIGWHVGSTTNNVLHGAACNVLAVRPRSMDV